ncbi:MAG: hypothetical protein R3C32_08335 [Chloroflexota bacterium]
MKATGEVMAIDRTFGAALNKALRGLEQAGAGFLAEDPSWDEALEALSGPAVGSRVAARPRLLRDFLAPSDSRLWRLLALLRRGVPAEELHRVTGIAPWFLAEMERLVGCPQRMREEETTSPTARSWPPSAPHSATDIATLSGISAADLAARRDAMGLHPGFAMVDTCAAEFAAETLLLCHVRGDQGHRGRLPVQRPAALVIGSGPVRIGQGIEFDYCAVRAAEALRNDGWQAVMVNSNPETVSTDFDASSRLYFEPSTRRACWRSSKPSAAPTRAAACAGQFGGQTPLNLSFALDAADVPTPGLVARDHRARGGADPLRGARGPAGHPTARRRHGHLDRRGAGGGRAGRLPGDRPASFVIGGLAIDFCFGPEDLVRQLSLATVVTEDRPVRIDAYLEGLEVDAWMRCAMAWTC